MLDKTLIFEFTAEIQIVGINPFVLVPDNILDGIFKQAGKNRGPIPIRGSVNGKEYQQTLIKYQGLWRLYINTTMLKNSPNRIGEVVDINIQVDQSDRTLAPHPKLLAALDENPEAKAIYEALTPSLRKEIVRYIAQLKTEESVDRNVIKAVDFLLGKGRFVGREKP